MAMPLVKTHLLSGRSVDDKRAIGDAVQAALVDVLGIPNEDLYQVFAEYSEANFRHTDGYLGLTYSDQLLLIEISFIEGRDDEMKKALLQAINANLVAKDLVNADDVFVIITEVGRANVSFGQGLAQRAQ
jgi:phenylpyruvate tautomerase PptA (4-oxalocrotonate tautomerase family)